MIGRIWEKRGVLPGSVISKSHYTMQHFEWKLIKSTPGYGMTAILTIDVDFLIGINYFPDMLGTSAKKYKGRRTK